MSSKFTGGPAFPTPGRAGMTLRDYFAAQALTGMLARAGILDRTDPLNGNDYATAAYQVADAMIRLREGR